MRVETDYSNVNQNVDKGSKTISHSSSNASGSGAVGAFALDISGVVTDNKAYGGQGKTAEDVMQEAGAIDVAQQKDYMTVMSNSMSGEDFAKLQEEGYNPNNMEIETMVTVVDKIKAELVKAGVEVSGYTDTLDMDTLTAITGDKAEAEMISSKLNENDIPVTKENVEAAKEALDKANELSELSEGATKYMIQNQWKPTIDNVYTAEYSSTTDGSRQGKGYYEDEMHGYYAKKAEDYNWNQLMPQIEKGIEGAGLEVNDDTVNDAKWLIEKGIPFTSDALLQLQELQNTTVRQGQEELMDSIAVAMAEGKKAGEALLSNQTGIYQQAVELLEEVESIQDEAIQEVVTNDQAINIRNLSEAQKRIVLDTENATTEESQITEQVTELSRDLFLTTKRQLAEIRLQMSVEANVKLLKSGLRIDTMQLEQLVEEYKKAEEAQNNILFGNEESTAKEVSDKAALYEETLAKTSEIASMPAAVIGRAIATGASSADTAFTLNYVHEQGTILQKSYQAAGETYEALMTAPRSDLGDSIKKAFQNVDELLDEIDMEQNAANRRAVRILGYNNMEISQENVNAVKEADEELTRVVNKLTPAATVQMIRDNVNPLETDMGTLEEYLSQLDSDTLNESEKFAKYLYKLEQNEKISEEEKDAYIGIYRLIRQVEKTDGAAIGSLVHQGVDISFKNLLSAVRTKKKSGMDVTVDDEFGGVNAAKQDRKTISEQINSINQIQYQENLTKDILDTIEPGALASMKNPISEEMTLEQLAEQLKTYGADKSDRKDSVERIDRQYQQEQLIEIRAVNAIEEDVVQSLIDFDQPVTVDNVLAADFLRNNRGTTFKKLYEAAREPLLKDRLDTAMEELQDSFTSVESANNAYEKLQSAAKEIVESKLNDTEPTSIDIKSIALTFKQISLATNMAKEENYEVPVKLGDEITSINLRIIRGGMTSKVTATTQTEKYGKLAAEFTLTTDTISGYIATDSEEGLQNLKKIEQELSENLESIQHTADTNRQGTIQLVYNRNLDIQKYQKEKTAATREDTGKEGMNTKEKVSSKELYAVAKSFLCSLQKGNSDR